MPESSNCQVRILPRAVLQKDQETESKRITKFAKFLQKMEQTAETPPPGTHRTQDSDSVGKSEDSAGQ